MDDSVKKEDSALTPEQIEEAIALWKEKNAKGGTFRGTFKSSMAI